MQMVSTRQEAKAKGNGTEGTRKGNTNCLTSDCQQAQAKGNGPEVNSSQGSANGPKSSAS